MTPAGSCYIYTYTQWILITKTAFDGVFNMNYTSILFNGTDGASDYAVMPPLPGTITMQTKAHSAFLRDLNLDQIINNITSEKEQYNLKPFFYTPLNNINTITYRQEIAKDLCNKELLESIKSFAGRMVIMRRYLSMINRLSCEFHKQGWFLEPEPNIFTV